MFLCSGALENLKRAGDEKLISFVKAHGKIESGAVNSDHLLAFSLAFLGRFPDPFRRMGTGVQKIRALAKGMACAMRHNYRDANENA